VSKAQTARASALVPDSNSSRAEEEADKGLARGEGGKARELRRRLVALAAALTGAPEPVGLAVGLGASSGVVIGEPLSRSGRILVFSRRPPYHSAGQPARRERETEAAAALAKQPLKIGARVLASLQVDGASRYTCSWWMPARTSTRRRWSR